MANLEFFNLSFPASLQHPIHNHKTITLGHKRAFIWFTASFTLPPRHLAAALSGSILESSRSDKDQRDPACACFLTLFATLSSLKTAAAFVQVRSHHTKHVLRCKRASKQASSRSRSRSRSRPPQPLYEQPKSNTNEMCTARLIDTHARTHARTHAPDITYRLAAAAVALPADRPTD